MAIAAFSDYAKLGMENTAALLNNIVYGAKGWMQKSDITWISTAVAYYGIPLVSENEWIGKIDAGQAAKFVAAACSIYGILQGVVAPAKNKAGSDVAFADLPNKDLILLTNTAVLALWGSKRLALSISPLHAVTAAVVSYAAVKMAHSVCYPTPAP